MNQQPQAPIQPIQTPANQILGNPAPTNNAPTNILNQGIQGITNTVNSVKDNITQTFDDFAKQPNASSDFNFSNTIIAKFAFLILVIIVFLFLINLGIIFISYVTAPKTNPYIVDGAIDGTNAITIPQDPAQDGAIPLQRSNNQSKGAEFTWSFWLYIDELPTNPKKYQHIFNKGTNAYDSSNIASVNNAPGVYLGNMSDVNAQNNLHIVMDTVDGANKNNTIDINNIPLKNWVHVAIRLENTILDTYINGTISSRLQLDNVPKQNYNDIQLCQNGGFQGKLSNMRYFNSALNVFEINTIITKGPNTNTAKVSGSKMNIKSGLDFRYLSNLWYGAKV
jgi:hypothetical protein